MVTSTDAGIDVGLMYADASARLRGIVGGDVGAPDALVEDACQAAWGRLVRHRDRVAPETALAWLVRTAVREAVKLTRRQAIEVSLEAMLEASGEDGWPSEDPGPDRRAEQHEQLDVVRLLPHRQQRLLWLHALGLGYAEMAEHEGCTRRTVERQLLRAKRTARAQWEGQLGPDR